MRALHCSADQACGGNASASSSSPDCEVAKDPTALFAAVAVARDVHDLNTFTTPAQSDERAWSITDPDQRRMVEWIRDAFAILCVRASGRSDAERKLRLGFEALLRHLGTSPLREVAKASPPAYGGMTASSADLRTIMKALDSCLAILERYDAVLTTAQRRMQILARATRRFAEEELNARTNFGPAMRTVTATSSQAAGTSVSTTTSYDATAPVNAGHQNQSAAAPLTPRVGSAGMAANPGQQNQHAG